MRVSIQGLRTTVAIAIVDDGAAVPLRTLTTIA